jgi:hypothetical protein
MSIVRFLAAATLLMSSLAASAAEVSAPHVKVTYEGVSEQQAKAVAETLSAAREVYVKRFGFDMPEQIRCMVECGAGKPSRLYTDGEDRVFLSLPSPDKLQRPARSGTFTLYGLCHELGHVAMYRVLKSRPWMTTGAAEGWAHYAGSAVVDDVYKARGEKLWTPDPYDYRADGTARLLRQLKEKNPSDVTQGAGQWQKLGVIVGDAGFAGVFRALEGARADGADAKAVSQALADALARAQPDKADALKQWWSGAAPVLLESVEASGFRKTGIDRAKLQRRPVKLEFDDGAADGKKSIAGGGHARKFAAPGGGDWYLTAISVHGARYGAPQPPASATFDVALCDADMRPIATWKQPYRAFERGESKWVRIEIPPTRVPPGAEGFYVALDFHPSASQGVYVSFDDATKGTDRAGSLVATPGKKGNPFTAGDWMIRAELDRPKSTDALE